MHGTIKVVVVEVVTIPTFKFYFQDRYEDQDSGVTNCAKFETLVINSCSKIKTNLQKNVRKSACSFLGEMTPKKNFSGK